MKGTEKAEISSTALSSGVTTTQAKQKFLTGALADVEAEFIHSQTFLFFVFFFP